MSVEPDPPAAPYYAQAESATLSGAYVALAAANDPLLSGTDSNYVRFTFTAADQTSNLTAALPADMPAGEYRVLARMRQTSGTADVEAQAGITTSAGSAAQVSAEAVTLDTPADLVVHDLGVVSYPAGGAPAGIGYSDGITPAAGYVRLTLTATGAGTYDVDYIQLIPTGSLAKMLAFDSAVGPFVFDGVRDATYRISTASPFDRAVKIVTAPGASVDERAGGVLMLTPGVANRLHAVFQAQQAIGDARTLSVSYWPRYLTVRPPAS